LADVDFKFQIKNNFQLNQSQPSLTCAWHSSAPACFSNFPQWGNIHPLVGVGLPQQINPTPVGGYPRLVIYITDLIWCCFISLCLQWAVIYQSWGAATAILLTKVVMDVLTLKGVFERFEN
jgi:hypothetical protein